MSRRLTPDAGRPAGPPPAGPAPGALAATSCVEVQRLVIAAGIITLGNQVIQVGSPLGGQRARIRLDGQVMHVITRDGILWRTLPCPIPPGQRHKLQDVRLAGPDPLPQSGLNVQRKVSSRGGIQVARQRIQVGFTNAGKTVTIELGDTSIRVIDEHGTLVRAILARTGTGRLRLRPCVTAGPGRQPCARAAASGGGPSSSGQRHRVWYRPRTKASRSAAAQTGVLLRPAR